VDFIVETVRKLEETIMGSGCEDNAVILQVNPDAVPCQYERGAVMEAIFGGKTAEFVTAEPIQATTRVAFMFGAPLGQPNLRAAACAIINVVTGFLCISRTLHSCTQECHRACQANIGRIIGGKIVYCATGMPAAFRETGALPAGDPESAEVLLINGDGIISQEGGELIAMYSGKKLIFFLGPSTAGVAALRNLNHFCPYGRS
jgi:hypothetical protein